MYAGKNIDSISEVGLCSKVVLDLMSGLEDYYNELYIDNCYSSLMYCLKTSPLKRITASSIVTCL